MARHIAHRLMISLPVLFGVLLIGFLLLQVVPTDPATVSAGPSATQADIAAIRQQMGLDQPLWVQFGRYLARILQFDLGRSMISNRAVSEEIALTLGPTIELLVACLIWAAPLGVLLGTLAARRHGSWIDRAKYGENIKEAERLLDEAGWKKGSDGFRTKDGKKLAPLIYGISGQFKEVAEAVQGDLRKIEIDLQIQLFDSTVAWGKLATQEFDAFGMSFPYVSAGDALNLYFRSTNAPTPNRMNWKDKETDELLDKGSQALDESTRTAAYQAVQQKVHDSYVWIPLYHEPLFLVSGARLKPMKAYGNYGCAMYKGQGIALK